MLKVLHVAGARPNFVKVAPVIAAMSAHGQFRQVFVHTGQHYDIEMSDVFFSDLGLPVPDANLEVGSDTHARQTAEVMLRLEPVVRAEAPDWVLVYGDVNSTLGAALVCGKLGLRVAHIEAGLRSCDRTMPEEINRVLTDQVSDLLFTTEADADSNLLREGIAPSRIRFVGNVMIDSLVRLLPRAARSAIFDQLGLKRGLPYFLVTLHRPNNVDYQASLQVIANSLARLAERAPIVFPMHPRTRQALEQHGLASVLASCQLLPPVGYIDFLALEQDAAAVITDSGGIQEETTYLGVPCLTVRPNTERPVTLTQGTNQLVPLQEEALVTAALQALADKGGQARPTIPLWDGHAAERIANVLASY